MKYQLKSATGKPVAALIGVGLSFFGSLLLAACFFPRPYHWRQTVMSSLASPRDNPHAYGIACAGVAISALFLLPFPNFLHQCLARFSLRSVVWAGRFLFVGAIFLALTALVVPGHYRVLGVRRVHEQLARIGAGGLCLALLCYLRAVFRLPRSMFWLRAVAAIFVALPIAAFLLSRLALVYAYAFLATDIYRAATTSSWGSLALWEWLGASSIYLFLAMMTLGFPETANVVQRKQAA